MAAGGGRRRGGKRSSASRQGSRHRSSTSFSEESELPHQNQLPHHLAQLLPALSAADAFLSRHDLRLLPSQTLTLETHLSSAAASLSSLLSLLRCRHPPKPLELNPPIPHPACWFQRFLSAAAAAAADCDRHWLDAFRMSKQSFTLLLRLLSPSLLHSLPSISPNVTLAAAIFRLAHGASYNAVGRRFGIDSAAACRAFFAVCKAACDKLGHIFELGSDMARVVVGFGWMSLPNCCGVLGLGRFPLQGEMLGKDAALMVQALVDCEGRFLDVSAGWPSTMRPDSILRQTKLFLGVEQTRELLNGQCFELSNGSSVPQYILGDSCFPLLPWLLTPFSRSNGRSSLSRPERAFNSVHSHGMRLVGTAFGRLRAQWQLLSEPWREECREHFPFVVITGCLLHNFLIKCSEPLPAEDVVCSKERKLPAFRGELSESGKEIREALALHLRQVSCRR